MEVTNIEAIFIFVYLWLLRVLLILPPTLTLSLPEAGFLLPFLQPHPFITHSFWLPQSLGLLASSGRSPLSFFPSPSLLSSSSLVCQPCSAWTLPSVCFLPYIYNKNLHIFGVVMASSFLFHFSFNFCQGILF